MKRIRLLCLGLCLLGGPGGPAWAQEAAPVAAPAAAHVRTTAYIVDALRLDAVFQKNVRRELARMLAADPPVLADLFARLDSPGFRERLRKHLGDMFAGILSPPEAERFARFLDTAGGRRFRQFVLEGVETGRRFNDMLQTDEERRDVAQAESDPLVRSAGGRFTALEKNPALRESLVRFFRAEGLDLDSVLRRDAAVGLRGKGQDGGLLAGLVRSAGEHLQPIRRRYSDVVVASAADDILRVENLVSAERRQRQLQVVAGLRQAQTVYAQDMATAYEILSRGADAYAAKDPQNNYLQQLRQLWRHEMETAYAHELAMNEAQVRVIDCFQRMLEFVALNQSVVSEENGTLVFNAPGLAEQYNGMRDQVQQAVLRQEKLLAASANARSQLLDALPPR